MKIEWAIERTLNEWDTHAVALSEIEQVASAPLAQAVHVFADDRVANREVLIREDQIFAAENGEERRKE
jgi:hypothetical protein